MQCLKTDVLDWSSIVNFCRIISQNLAPYFSFAGGSISEGPRDQRVNGILGATRGLGNHGDPALKKCVITEPYTTSVPIDQYAQFLIIASNGVWEVFSEHEASSLLTQVSSYIIVSLFKRCAMHCGLVPFSLKDHHLQQCTMVLGILNRSSYYNDCKLVKHLSSCRSSIVSSSRQGYEVSERL